MTYDYVVKRPYANFHNFLEISLDSTTIFGLSCANSHLKTDNSGHEAF